MGQVSWKKSAIAAVLLLATYAVLQFVDGQKYQPDYKVPLAESQFADNGWIGTRDLPMTDNVVEALSLDDYLFRQYRSLQGDIVTLYIGFYYSSDKVGAAHDPLVCFQGQGWRVSDRDKGQTGIAIDQNQKTVDYATMLATNQDHQEYVFYWFQAFDQAASSTMDQKLSTFANKLEGKGTANAFVRVTTTVADGDVAAAKARALAFTQSFYPSFYRYVVNN